MVTREINTGIYTRGMPVAHRFTFSAEIVDSAQHEIIREAPTNDEAYQALCEIMGGAVTFQHFEEEEQRDSRLWRIGEITDASDMFSVLSTAGCIEVVEVPIYFDTRKEWVGELMTGDTLDLTDEEARHKLTNTAVTMMNPSINDPPGDWTTCLGQSSNDSDSCKRVREAGIISYDIAQRTVFPPFTLISGKSSEVLHRIIDPDANGFVATATSSTPSPS